jgi:hypothetical protein
MVEDYWFLGDYYSETMPRELPMRPEVFYFYVWGSEEDIFV